MHDRDRDATACKISRLVREMGIERVGDWRCVSECGWMGMQVAVWGGLECGGTALNGCVCRER